MDAGGEVFQSLGIWHPALSSLEPSLGYSTRVSAQTRSICSSRGCIYLFQQYLADGASGITPGSQLCDRVVPIDLESYRAVTVLHCRHVWGHCRAYCCLADISRTTVHSVQAGVLFPSPRGCQRKSGDCMRTVTARPYAVAEPCISFSTGDPACPHMRRGACHWEESPHHRTGRPTDEG